jgi:hypothetical protein
VFPTAPENCAGITGAVVSAAYAFKAKSVLKVFAHPPIASPNATENNVVMTDVMAPVAPARTERVATSSANALRSIHAFQFAPTKNVGMTDAVVSAASAGNRKRAQTDCVRPMSSIPVTAFHPAEYAKEIF